MFKVKCKRICAGYYQTINTVPQVNISKLSDGTAWEVSYDNYFGLWSTYTECRTLIEDIVRLAPGEHCFPIEEKKI